ncbi:MAG TPA: polysaccharide biosynthesis/export family protein [Candidatus Wunengus sp. YC61]|uniref:polysaccharide biosynthesis/export family protein n=1 Tax=Candidatus Wunengus sp. YC61 TaxID=3367698 RepID=UPI0040273E3D
MNIVGYLFILLISLFLSSCSSIGLRGYLFSGDNNVAQKASEVNITSVVTSEQENNVRITVNADNEFSYNFFNHYEPASLVIDISNGKFVNLPQEMTVRKGNVASIGIAQIAKPDNSGRLIINLDKMSAYNIYKENKSLIIDVDKKSLQQNIEIGGEQVAGNKIDVVSDKRHFDYTIGGKDVLSITIYDEPDLSYDQRNNRSLRVSIDGMISFPLLGYVKVAGLTPFELEKKLDKLLSEGYLVNPHVSVIVAEYHSKEIYVLGAVRSPGVYPLLGKESILEILSKAGGVSTSEAGSDIIILRKNVSADNTVSQKSLLDTSAVSKTNTPINREIEYIRLNLQKLFKKGDIALNIDLQDQDTLYIPMAESIFVFGQVGSPGAIKLLEKDITVTEAISMAGGFTGIASPSRTRIVRMENGVEKTIYINVNKIVRGKKSKDIILKAGDIIVVPEAFF